MKFFSLCSSSKGNCSYITYQNQAIFIDMGAKVNSLRQFLLQSEREREEIQGLFLTHEHSDHIKGLHYFTKDISCPVYGTYGTLSEVLKKKCVHTSTVLHEIDKKKASLGDFSVTPFHTPHDSEDSLGYIVEAGAKKIGICTDLGTCTPVVKESLIGCDFIFLEANYDEAMLAVGSYPASLKRRIASDHGHLSNNQAAIQIAEFIKEGTQHFMLGHLSEENNLPELAWQTVTSYLSEQGMKIDRDYTLAIAPVESADIVVEV